MELNDSLELPVEEKALTMEPVELEGRLKLEGFEERNDGKIADNDCLDSLRLDSQLR